MKEGQVYILSNFKVSTYQGDESNRALRNEKHIFFDSETKMELLKEVVPNFPDYAFDLFRLTDVEKCLTDNRFLIGNPMLNFTFATVHDFIIHQLQFICILNTFYCFRCHRCGRH